MVLKYAVFLLLNLCLGVSLFGNQGIKWINEDLIDLERSAQEGDSYAQGFLALCHIHGEKGLNISLDTATYWAKLSAEKNHWLGLFAMGYVNRFPPLGPDPEKVSKYYNQVFSDPDGRLVKNASVGDPVASYVIGEIFTAEELEPQLTPDIEFAAKHYAISSQGGYAPGSVQHALLKIHANSIGSPNLDIGKDIEGGIQLLNQLVKLGLPSAHHFLGHSFFKGIGVDKDYKMALVHFQAAADRGYSSSLLIVAHFYAYGLTGPAKIDLALRYANLALSHEREKAAEKIAEYESLLAGPKDSSQNDSVETSDMNVPSPTNDNMDPPPLPPSPQPQNKISPEFTSSNDVRLPSIYQQEMPKEPIVQVREEPVINPVNNVNPINDADNLQLAKKHYFERIPNADFNVAYKLFLDSSETGNAEAARYIGLMYLSGKGVDKDLNKALTWFEKAVQGGDELSKRNLKTLKMLIVDK